MNGPGRIFFETPDLLLVAAGVGVAIAALVWWRGARLRIGVRVLGAIGVMFLILATGGMRWRAGPPLRVVVMVDRSDSTRQASFHDDDAIQPRLDVLLDGVAYDRVDFGAGEADRTRFIPPPGDAVVLFSDARFDLPLFAPPTFVMVDPKLNEPPDAAITQIQIRENEVAIDIRNSGGKRTLTVSQGNQTWTREIQPGRYTVSAPFAGRSERIVASLSAGDAWPENDSLAIDPPPPATRELWWVGSDAPVERGWRAMSPDQLPTDAGAYLVPAAIVLDNIGADRLSSQQLDRLSQFVRQFGGGLVIGGGDAAFAAGGYVGTALDALSPMASSAPDPQRRWILLADASGSMAATFGGSTRWAFASEALSRALRTLPPNDPVSIGTFAEHLQWWSTGKTVRQTLDASPPHNTISPSGPTNLQAALEQIAAATPAAAPTELFVLTDAEATLSDAASLASTLGQHQIRLHLLATAPVDASNPVATLARSTGGNIVSQIDPRLWSDSIIQMSRAAIGTGVQRDPVTAASSDELPELNGRVIDEWNRTWLKPDAQLLATASHESQTIPLAGAWNIGEGRVAAVALNADTSVIEPLALRIAAAPRDPRFSVSWEPSAVTVDAIEDGNYMNDLTLSLRLNARLHALTQTAPGRYVVRFDPPPAPSLAELVHDGRVVDRRSLAGRYSGEFDEIGNDHEAMQQLADRTGGAVISPDQREPIRWPPSRGRSVSLTPYLAITGVVLIGAALLVWKRMA